MALHALRGDPALCCRLRLSHTILHNLHDVWLGFAQCQSQFLGRGSDEALFSEEKGLFSEKGGGIH